LVIETLLAILEKKSCNKKKVKQRFTNGTGNLSRILEDELFGFSVEAPAKGI